jgi:carboxyl-terminal processing protease
MKITLQRRQLLKLLGIIALCAASFGAGLWAAGRMRSPNENLIDAAYSRIANDSLFNQHTGQQLSYAAIRGMLATIDDPYAELIEPMAAQNFTSTFSGQTGVIGLYAENKAGQVVITIVFPGGPAGKAGLQVGDVILAIDGVTLDQYVDSSEAGLMMRGSPGTMAHVKVQRNGQVLEYDVTRQVRDYVAARMLPDGIGYISLNAFNRTATQQMKDSIEALMAQKPTGLVWDLRNNEGGDMQAAQDILSDFIKKDSLLFTAELTHGRTVQFLAKGNPIAADILLVVLMDKTTYSAAETCAAAIAETDRGTTVGSSSYGKGVIQATIPLIDNTLLQMTIARWRSPNGEWYQGRGVAPQIEVSDDPATEEDEPLQKAVEILTASTRQP